MKNSIVAFATLVVSFLCTACEDYQVVTPQSTVAVRIFRLQNESFDASGKKKEERVNFSPFSPQNPQDSAILNGVLIRVGELPKDSLPFALDGGINTLLLKRADTLKLESRFSVPTGEIRIKNYHNGDTVDLSKDLTVQWDASDFKGDRVQLTLDYEVSSPMEGSVNGSSQISSYYLDAETGSYTFLAARIGKHLSTKCSLIIRRFVDFSIEREPLTYDFELGSAHTIMMAVR